MFVHVAAQFCHPSLGTKIHLNVQNVNEPIHMPATEKFFGATTLKELTADNSTHLMVYIHEGGVGGAATNSPCKPKLYPKKLATQFSKNGCGRRLGRSGEYGDALRCAGVSIIQNPVSIVNLYF